MWFKSLLVVGIGGSFVHGVSRRAGPQYPEYPDLIEKPVALIDSVWRVKHGYNEYCFSFTIITMGKRMGKAYSGRLGKHSSGNGIGKERGT